MRVSRLAGIVGGLVAALPAGARALPPPDAATAPPRLRICCALGYDLALRFGARRAPVGVQNVIELDDLGHHRYRARSVFDEKNGLVHTCRAGFIDLGHLRSAADLFAHVQAKLQQADGGEVVLAVEDGEARIAVAGPLDRAALEGVAQRVAFDLTVWHEIVTGVGDRTVPIFSEAFSAFSPEDLYSDLVGTHLGAAAVRSPLPYDEAMDALIHAFLTSVDAGPISRSRRALDQVEGRWWTRAVPVPERDLLLVRNPAFGPEIRPWQVPAPEALGCGGARPLSVSRPAADASGRPLAGAYQLSLRPPAKSPLAPGPYVEEDFEALVKRATEDLRAPEDPPPADTEDELAGIRVMAFRGFGGVSASDEEDPRATGGFEVVGARSEGRGGDLSLIRFGTAYGNDPAGLRMHFTGIQAEHLFFCTERGGDRVHPPISAWFQSCEPSGVFGIGGTLAQVQHDGGTGRWVMRPVEAHASFSLLNDAFAPSFDQRHLILSSGFSVENATAPDVDSDLSIRAHLQLRGRLASADQRWQADLHALYRQDLLDRGDYAAELSLALVHRLLHRAGDDRAPIWGVTTLGVELAATRWTHPMAALDDHLLPLTPADVQDSLRAQLTLGFSFERWVF